MKTNEIKNLFTAFESIVCNYEGVECWSARELQSLLGYTEWRNFSKAIEKAKESCKNATESISNHFVDINKTIPMPKGVFNQFKVFLFFGFLVNQ